MPRREFLNPGQTVGLLGGSFNPAHQGHVHVSRMALRALGLDRLWWLVSPQNPLKDSADTAPLKDRLARARALARDPRISVTDIERRLGTRYTVDTVRALKRRYPGVRFVWIMGSDNLLQLPRWARWRELIAELPIAIYPRPGSSLKARGAPALNLFRGARLDAADARLLPFCAAPALVFLEGPEHHASSTALRARI